MPGSNLQTATILMNKTTTIIKGMKKNQNDDEPVILYFAQMEGKCYFVTAPKQEFGQLRAER
jgi:hypothetical protein